MTLKELVLKNRSYRRFQQEASVPLETLRGLVDLARLSASGGNHHPAFRIFGMQNNKI
jgi:nitroreductase